MTATTTSRIEHHDQWVQHAQGRLFTRSWTPVDPRQQASSRAASPLILFHDSLGCVELWRDFPAALSRVTGRRVIAYDRLGFGKSDARTERPSLGFVAEESALYFPALREQLGVQGFVALGHSVGGGMAIHCAAEAGSDCEALITIAAQVFAEDRTLQGIRAAREQFRDAAQVQRLARYHGDKTRWVLDAWIENWLHPGFASWTLAPVLPRVSCPVLALHGELDEYGSTRHPELIGSLCGGPARVEVLPGIGHVPHREQPQRVLPLVAGLLAG
jgi:pimeloyl-ACP methyl ester carboxylesterase